MRHYARDVLGYYDIGGFDPTIKVFPTNFQKRSSGLKYDHGFAIRYESNLLSSVISKHDFVVSFKLLRNDCVVRHRRLTDVQQKFRW